MRKIECNYCKKGEGVLSEVNGRASSSASLRPRAQNALIAVSEFFSAVLGGPKTVSKKEAKGGKCPECNDTGFLEDYTDTSKQDKAAADYLQSKSDRILELETKLGNSPGGNMVRRVAGAKVEIIGRTLNNAKSYTVHKGKASYRAGGIVTGQGRASVPVGPPKGKGTNVVTGNNPPANTGGGLYYIQCGNKFKLVTGAQGIEFSTNGPISFDGGMVRFTGAEVSVGSSQGPTVLEGDHLQLNGKSITLTPSGQTGAVSVDGSIATTGNFQSGGAYIDNLYFSNATCPEKQETSKISSQTDLIGGPAQWSGNTGFLATKNLIKWAQDSVADFALAGAMNPLNPRSMLKMKDNIVNSIYGNLPVEPIPTGVILPGTPIAILAATCPCNAGGGPASGVITGIVTAPIPLSNFPHTHTMPDEAHSHNYSVPAIAYKGHTAESVRAEANAAGINSRIPAAASGGAGDYLTKAVGAGIAAGKAVGGLLYATDGHKISGQVT